ncbi:fibronectin type III domain-containing protein [Streptomyces sp. enrichment culture]|uniref:fibronectin type III domain-containing protein n=1 Tax=Streptomyces sp. enrichment culture TaxID=1795815 RepID=UPI003F56DEEA
MKPARRTTSAVATAVALTTAGGLLTAVSGPASAATACGSPVFTRQFFANTTFSGIPKKTDCDRAVDESWGAAAPASGLPSDRFGVRWTVTRDFGSGGPFTFTASAQDGIRVHLDGVRRIDLWKNISSTASKTVNVTIPSGKHTLRVDFVNWTGHANVKFAYSPRTSATVDTVRPLAPTGTAVTYDPATGRAKVTWARNKEMDLAGYRVYRRLSGSGSWTWLTGTTATSFTDAPPATGDTYVYEVRAHDKAGNRSAGGADRAVTTADRTAPAVPSAVTATDGQPGVTVAWTAVPGATAYLVHRRWDDDGGDNPVTQVAKVTAASWRDATVKEGLYYSYWVTAVDAAGNRSAKSAPRSVYHGDWAPSAPTGLTAAPVAGSGIRLTWKAPLSPPVYDIGRYRIYADGELVDEVTASRLTYLDEWVGHGTAYTYTVTAVDHQGQESAPSAPATATAPATGLAPAPVAGLRGWMYGTDVALEWQPNTEDDVHHYDVYRAVRTDDVWRYEKQTEVRHGDEPRLSYVTDFHEPQGEEARWAVVAVDHAGNSRFTSGEPFSYVTVLETPSRP